MNGIAGAALVTAIVATGALRAEEGSFAERTAEMEPRRGLLTFWVDEDTGGIWLEVPPTGSDGVVGEYLYVEGLVTGLGSNPVGLDRGPLGRTRRVWLRPNISPELTSLRGIRGPVLTLDSHSMSSPTLKPAIPPTPIHPIGCTRDRSASSSEMHWRSLGATTCVSSRL